MRSLPCFLTVLSLLSPTFATAQVFNGGGVGQGIEEAAGVTGISDADPRDAVITAVTAILDFMALIAVVTVIIAGIYMIVSLGNDEQKDKAKKIIFYTLIGLAVILFSRVIVSLVTEWLASEV
jgi:hypothetical protein